MVCVENRRWIKNLLEILQRRHRQTFLRGISRRSGFPPVRERNNQDCIPFPTVSLPRSLCAVICFTNCCWETKIFVAFREEIILAAKMCFWSGNFHASFSSKFLGRSQRFSCCSSTAQAAATFSQGVLRIIKFKQLSSHVDWPAPWTERNELPLPLQTFTQGVWLYRRVFGFLVKVLEWRLRLCWVQRLK